jgi:hypothetical protein
VREEMVMEEIVGVLEMSDRIDAYPAEKASQGEYEKKQRQRNLGMMQIDMIYT